MRSIDWGFIYPDCNHRHGEGCENRAGNAECREGRMWKMPGRLRPYHSIAKSRLIKPKGHSIFWRGRIGERKRYRRGRHAAREKT